MEFIGFPKIPRYSRTCTIQEKIDGTNAQIAIATGHKDLFRPLSIAKKLLLNRECLFMFAGSRSRWLTIGNDNFGFAEWVRDHSDELFALGTGRHFGEWWGRGIQRGYGLSERRLSLFNMKRWSDPAVRPACCGVVPVISVGLFSDDTVLNAMNTLRTYGSVAAPGFMDPEGIVIYHVAGGVLFKKTMKDDDNRNGVENA